MFSSDPDFIDYTGQVFGKYFVIDFAETRISRSGAKFNYWLVRCKCKRKKVISTYKLEAGKYQTCDCKTAVRA